MKRWFTEYADTLTWQRRRRSDVYADYAAWCGANGSPCASTTALYAYMRVAAGMAETKSGNETFFVSQASQQAPEHVTRWLATHVGRRQGCWAPRDRLRDSYKAWCAETGTAPASLPSLYDAIRTETGSTESGRNGVRGFRGIFIRNLDAEREFRALYPGSPILALIGA